jgi:hypothetical protein
MAWRSCQNDWAELMFEKDTERDTTDTKMSKLGSDRCSS